MMSISASPNNEKEAAFELRVTSMPPSAVEEIKGAEEADCCATVGTAIHATRAQQTAK